MKQWMPGDAGWTDHGPSRRPSLPTPAEVLRKRKRPLTEAERRARIGAAEDLAAFEKWEKDGFCSR